MASDRPDPSEQIPETDLLEQQPPLDPPLTDDEPDSVHRGDAAASAEPVDEADHKNQPMPPSWTAAETPAIIAGEPWRSR
jgi:hypothetical protein